MGLPRCRTVTLATRRCFRSVGDGIVVERKAAYDSLCPVTVGPNIVLKSCDPELEGSGISPDGTRLAYAFWGWRSPSKTDVGVSAIAILDLATGHVTTLDATRTNPETCDTAGQNNPPTWSVHGMRLVFTRDSIGSLAEGACADRVLSVNADGSDLREVEPPDALRGPDGAPIRTFLDHDHVLAADAGGPTVNRPLFALGLGMLLAACAVGVTPSREPQPSPSSRSPTAYLTTPPTPALSPSPSPSPVAWPEGVVAYPVGSGNSPLPYLEYLPPGYGDGTPRPLLVFLHGVDEAADGTETSVAKILGLGIPRLIAEGDWPSERPFVVLMPQEPVAKSQRCDFGIEIGQFLEYAVDRYEIDEARVYLTGISCGAIGVWDYLASATDGTVAAAVPISGHPRWAMDKAGCAVARVPIWDFQGALDDIVPVQAVRNAIDELRSCTDPRPSELRLTIYPDADHDAWTRTYDLSAGNDVYAWLLGHSKP
jgi:hypothetical protein